VTPPECGVISFGFLRQRLKLGQSELRVIIKLDPGKESNMKILAIALALTLLFSFAATAGQNPDVKCAVHVEAHSARRNCGALPVFTDCPEIVTTFEGLDVDAMPVMFDVVGVTGAEYGLTWPVWAYSCIFTSCSDLTTGDIVNPGDGISHAWNVCQMGFATVCGWGWLTADGPGLICPIPRAESGFLGVADCSFIKDAAIGTYCAGVGGEFGDDPSEATATEASTWGGIKSMFR
jgi:hypothetical protein